MERKIIYFGDYFKDFYRIIEYGTFTECFLFLTKGILLFYSTVFKKNQKTRLEEKLKKH